MSFLLRAENREALHNAVFDEIEDRLDLANQMGLTVDKVKTSITQAFARLDSIWIKIRQGEQLSAEVAIHTIPYEDLDRDQLSLLPLFFKALGFIQNATLEEFVRFSFEQRNDQLAKAFWNSQLVTCETYMLCQEQARASSDARDELYEKMRETLETSDFYSPETVLLEIRKAMNLGFEDVAIRYLNVATLTEVQMIELVRVAGKMGQFQILSKVAQIAIEAHNIRLFRRVFEAGLNPTVRLFTETTYLHLCARSGFEKGISLLLEKGVDPNSLDAANRTPLHAGLERNAHPTALRKLVCKTNLSLTDYLGRTALEVAAMDENGALYYLPDLIKNGTPLTLKRAFNCTNVTNSLSPATRDFVRNELRKAAPYLTFIEEERELNPPLYSEERAYGQILSSPSWGEVCYHSAGHNFLERLLTFNPVKNLGEEVYEALEVGMEYFSTLDHTACATRVLEGKLTIFPVCSQTHMKYILFWAGHMIIADRDGKVISERDNFKSLDIYSFENRDIKIEDLAEELELLHSFREAPTSELSAFCHLHFPMFLGGNRTELTYTLETLSPPNYQDIQNCIYSNFEAILSAIKAIDLVTKGHRAPEAVELTKLASRRFSIEMKLEAIQLLLELRPIPWPTILHGVEELSLNELAYDLSSNYGFEVEALFEECSLMAKYQEHATNRGHYAGLTNEALSS